jgi:hypothetical protein
MNVLGETFDSKLNWSEQAMKANKGLNFMKLIRKYFLTTELQQLVTCNLYSVLYFNSEIWNSPCLSHHSKRLLMSASGNAGGVCLHY